MTGKKDKPALNNLIIELAKANDWLSRDDLKEITGKPIKTIKVYVQKDIFNFIDTKDFIELVNRNTGQGKTNIEKYKLKSSLDNLLAIFNFIEGKSEIKQLMQTDYYKTLIPEIEKKSKNEFKKIRNDRKTFKIKEIETLYDIGFNLSPSFIHFVLRHDSKNIESNETIKKIMPNGLNSDLLFMICYGLIVYDNLEGTITDQDLISQILGQS